MIHFCRMIFILQSDAYSDFISYPMALIVVDTLLKRWQGKSRESDVEWKRPRNSRREWERKEKRKRRTREQDREIGKKEKRRNRSSGFLFCLSGQSAQIRISPWNPIPIRSDRLCDTYLIHMSASNIEGNESIDDIWKRYASVGHVKWSARGKQDKEWMTFPITVRCILLISR